MVENESLPCNKLGLLHKSLKYYVNLPNIWMGSKYRILADVCPFV